MDLNFRRRRREVAVAREVADAFLQATDATALAPPEKLAHHFGLVCQRLDFVPNEMSAGRVLQYASKEIDRRRRVLGDLTTALDNAARAISGS
jgi:hypothetical protein